MIFWLNLSSKIEAKIATQPIIKKNGLQPNTSVKNPLKARPINPPIIVTPIYAPIALATLSFDEI